MSDEKRGSGQLPAIPGNEVRDGIDKPAPWPAFREPGLLARQPEATDGHQQPGDETCESSI
jgi:hypothetical protein